MCWFTPLISVLERWRQKHREIKVVLSYLKSCLSRKTELGCPLGLASFWEETSSSRPPESVPKLMEHTSNVMKKGRCGGGEQLLPQAHPMLNSESPAHLPAALFSRPSAWNWRIERWASPGKVPGWAPHATHGLLPGSPTTSFPLKLFPFRNMLRASWAGDMVSLGSLPWSWQLLSGLARIWLLPGLRFAHVLINLFLTRLKAQQ